jgi:hypothetical protein
VIFQKLKERGRLRKRRSMRGKSKYRLGGIDDLEK